LGFGVAVTIASRVKLTTQRCVEERATGQRNEPGDDWKGIGNVEVRVSQQIGDEGDYCARRKRGAERP
jgi:hypothetical protein